MHNKYIATDKIFNLKEICFAIFRGSFFAFHVILPAFNPCLIARSAYVPEKTIIQKSKRKDSPGHRDVNP